MKNFERETLVETDVLVIGGGLAGCFAAVKARETGADVTMVVKGTIGRSGQTPWADATMVFSPEWTPKFEPYAAKVYERGEYLNNRDWTERVIKESYARFQDLVSWGIVTLKEPDGKDKRMRLSSSEPEPGRVWSMGSSGAWVKPLRSQPQKLGVRIMERIMIVELLRDGGAVVGAVGIATDSWDLYVFKSKAVVICTGAGGFKPVGGWPLGDLTADGQVMAYRAGVEITGKEFEDFHNLMVTRTGGLRLPDFERRGSPFEPARDAEGQELPAMGFGLSGDFVAHAGGAPIRRGEEEFFSNVAFGMSVHTAEGVWPVDDGCASGVPGLYAAGDACATMTVGAQYGIFGGGTAAASVTGTRAGLAAARYARQTGKPVVSESNLAQARELVIGPARLAGGFSPNWVTQQLKNTLMPYFVLRVKHGDRLKAALTMVEFMRDHLSPKIFARDPHELRLAHETRSMIINAEMKLRASLFRTESRGTHYREDYPRRADPEWLAWVMLKEEDGRMKVSKKPVPEKWWPDLSVPYKQRYPARFPGEE
jgi:succinate dehydrogenase/fumarate reductase flavoprotein subunit